MKSKNTRAVNRHSPRWRTLTVFAQDPLVRDSNGMSTKPYASNITTA